MGNINVSDILGYGVIGLGFLLALFAFRLLSNEQKRDEPRKSMIRAIYSFMLFSLLLSVIGFAGEFSKISESEQEQITKLQDSLTGCEQKGKELEKAHQKKIASCDDQKRVLQQERDARLAVSDFRVISAAYFETVSTRGEVLTTVGDLIKEWEGLASNEQQNEAHYAYKLFKLEKTIPTYGAYIDTRILNSNGSLTDVYALIQQILQGIRFYEGEVNGDQQLTYEALVKFQQTYNAREQEHKIPQEDLGLFGYRTLELVRNTYRRPN